MKKIKTGVVGFGYISRTLHCPFIELHDEFELTGILQRKGTSCEELYPNAIHYSCYEDMLLNDEIDLILLTVPNHLHFEMVEQALNHHKHVLVEKPFVLTKVEGEMLIDLAAKVNKEIFVFQNRRYDGDFLTVKDLIARDVLGDIQFFKTTWNIDKPVHLGKEWKEAGIVGNDLLYDLGPHMFDQILTIFGYPKKMTCHAEIVRPDSKVIDDFSGKFIYDDFTVEFEASRAAKMKSPRFYVEGALGTYVKYGFEVQEAQLSAGFKPTDALYGTESPDQFGEITFLDGTSTKVHTLPGNYMHFFDNVADVILYEEEIGIKAKEALQNIEIIEKFEKENKTEQS